MKKLFFLLCIINMIILCGCDNVQEIENNRIITACIVREEKDNFIYGFYVSIPTGSEGGENSGSKSSAALYEFEADNFETALKLFEDSGVEKTDISHMSLIAGDKEYFDNFYSQDEKHIRNCISATPLIYTCIINGNHEDFVNCISSEYNSKAEDFSKNILDSKSTVVSCNFSDLSLSVNNKYYTCAIPVVSIEKHGKVTLPKITGICMYSEILGIKELTDNEFKVYGKWRHKNQDEIDGYKINVYDDRVYVTLNNKELIDIARKYILMDIDILNIKYYLKKCFLTYDGYEKFLNKYDIIDTSFLGDEK